MRLPRWLSSLGPGLTAGAADDDPSGIATHSIIGARTGTALLWAVVLTWPLMAFVQMAAARIGMVTGRGLAAVFRKKFPAPVIVVGALLLFVTNTVNIAADLAGMGEASELFIHVPARWFILLYGIALPVVTIRLPYPRIAATLKWLTLALLAYVVAGIALRPDWSSIARDSVVPRLPAGLGAGALLVGIVGTSLSPYFLFWQASQEVEEEKAIGRSDLGQRIGATHGELSRRRWDIGIGSALAKLVLFFIVVTTAMTLHRHGITRVESSRQVAEALRPLAGRFANVLYAAGLLGVGFLALPTLSGSAAYAMAETFAWRQGLNEAFLRARAFYVVLLLSTLGGVALNLLGVNAVAALFWAGVANGLLAPFLLAGIYLVAADRQIMKDQPCPRGTLAMVALSAAVSLAAAAAMLLLG